VPEDFTALAAWFDDVDHDGCTPAATEARFHALVERGWIALDGARWTLVARWPRDDEPRPTPS
jgi:hypothetical protein